MKEVYQGTNALKMVNMNNIRFAIKKYNNYQSKWMNDLRKYN